MSHIQNPRRTIILIRNTRNNTQITTTNNSTFSIRLTTISTRTTSLRQKSRTPLSMNTRLHLHMTVQQNQIHKRTNTKLTKHLTIRIHRRIRQRQPLTTQRKRLHVTRLTQNFRALLRSLNHNRIQHHTLSTSTILPRHSLVSPRTHQRRPNSSIHRPLLTTTQRHLRQHRHNQRPHIRNTSMKPQPNTLRRNLTRNRHHVTHNQNSKLYQSPTNERLRHLSQPISLSQMRIHRLPQHPHQLMMTHPHTKPNTRQPTHTNNNHQRTNPVHTRRIRPHRTKPIQAINIRPISNTNATRLSLQISTSQRRTRIRTLRPSPLTPTTTSTSTRRQLTRFLSRRIRTITTRQRIIHHHRLRHRTSQAVARPQHNTNLSRQRTTLTLTQAKVTTIHHRHRITQQQLLIQVNIRSTKLLSRHSLVHPQRRTILITKRRTRRTIIHHRIRTPRITRATNNQIPQAISQTTRTVNLIRMNIKIQQRHLTHRSQHQRRPHRSSRSSPHTTL